MIPWFCFDTGGDPRLGVLHSGQEQGRHETLHRKNCRQPARNFQKSHQRFVSKMNYYFS